MVSTSFPPIPAETARAALAIFGRSNFYIWAGDRAVGLFSDLPALEAPPELNVPPLSIPMYFMFIVFQYLEGLPDRRAIDALRARLDWKYALHLPVNFLEIGANTLCGFRRWLRNSPDGLQNLRTLFQRFSEYSAFPGEEGDQSIDALKIVNHLCWLNRTAEVWETMSQALGAVVVHHPDWLRCNSLAHWYIRYTPNKHHGGECFGKPDWEEYVRGIGCDGQYLLDAIQKAGRPGLADLPEITAMRKVWSEQFEQVAGEVVWRKENCAECRRLENGRYQASGR